MPCIGSPGLDHQAFLYRSQAELVAGLGPFIRDGLERDETVCVVARRPNVEALRDDLGADAELIQLQDTSEWETHPYERLQALIALVEELPAGGALRAMGEPLWNGSHAVVREWARFESIVNMALAGAPMRCVCLYHTGELPDCVLDHAVRTHPRRMGNGASLPSASFVPPEEFQPGQPACPPPAAESLPPEGSEFRHALAEHALCSGLPRQRVNDLVLAANEVATNAHKHGSRPVRARVWAEDGELICQIADGGGAAEIDPLAGWVPPADLECGGLGLTIARRLCDALEIAPGSDGTTVSLHVALTS